VNLSEQSADNPAHPIEKEIAAATGRIEELTVQLADIEEKLGEARNKTERLKDDLQKALAEVQRSPKLAEQRLAVLQEKEATARTKVSEKIESPYDVCAGEVRWRKDGLLEQLWRGGKTTEEWRLVPEI
jgi:chromosome segregation ATPase